MQIPPFLPRCRRHCVRQKWDASSFSWLPSYRDPGSLITIPSRVGRVRHRIQASLRLVDHVSRHAKWGSGLDKLTHRINEATRRVCTDFPGVCPIEWAPCLAIHGECAGNRVELISHQVVRLTLVLYKNEAVFALHGNGIECGYQEQPALSRSSVAEGRPA